MAEYSFTDVVVHEGPNMFMSGTVKAWREQSNIKYDINVTLRVKGRQGDGYVSKTDAPYGFGIKWGDNLIVDWQMLTHDNGADGRTNLRGNTYNLTRSGTLVTSNEAKRVYFYGYCYDDDIIDNCEQGYPSTYITDFQMESYNPYTPPGTVTDLRINTSSVNNQSDNITLSWTAPSGGSDGITGYRVYYKTTGGYSQIGTPSGTSFTTNIASLNNRMARGTTMTFYVVPYNSGGTGGNSNTVNCTFNNVQCNLSLNSVTFSSIKINWSSQVQIKTVQYKTGSGNWISRSVSGTSGVIEITGLNPSTAYSIYVQLVANSTEEGVGSNSITARTNTITARASTSDITLTSVRINWNCDTAVKQVEYKLNNNNYKVATTGINATSGSFIITGLHYKASYTVQLSLVTNINDIRVSCSVSFVTLDIARITEYPITWNLDENGTIKASLPNISGVAYAFGISYQNTEIISRSNISFVNNQYTFNLTNQEKLYIYNITNLVNAPRLKLNLRTYQSQYIDVDSKDTTLTFNTKAWKKVSGVWRRALVWLKVNGQWRTTTPWVKVGSTWKKV